jgi:hypothetical protein
MSIPFRRVSNQCRLLSLFRMNNRHSWSDPSVYQRTALECQWEQADTTRRLQRRSRPRYYTSPPDHSRCSSRRSAARRCRCNNRRSRSEGTSIPGRSRCRCPCTRMTRPRSCLPGRTNWHICHSCPDQSADSCTRFHTGSCRQNSHTCQRYRPPPLDKHSHMPRNCTNPCSCPCSRMDIRSVRCPRKCKCRRRK